MANHPKDPRKTEFIELFRRTGWTQAELARKLEMTRGGVNGIVTGPTIPSAAALQFLRLTLLAERPQALGLQSFRLLSRQGFKSSRVSFDEAEQIELVLPLFQRATFGIAPCPEFALKRILE